MHIAQALNAIPRLLSLLLLFFVVNTPLLLSAESTAAIGSKAPDFTLPGSDGKEHSLSSYKGKIVVLEWVNYECPFVKKHYDAAHKNMQALQGFAKEKDIVWISINSSAEGKQGYMTPTSAVELAKERGAIPVVTLLDHTGKVGKMYGAKTTPHMYIIDKDGVLRYQGAIDSTASTDPSDIPEAKNYVRQALDELLAGKPVSETLTESYGCSVKYAF